VLGELSPVQRRNTRTYFDCAECASDLKAAAAFVDAAREVLRQETASSLAKNSVTARGRCWGGSNPLRRTGVRGSVVDYRLSEYGHDSAREGRASSGRRSYLLPHMRKDAVHGGKK